MGESGAAVITAVTALVKAYRDAGSVVHNIRQRRTATGAATTPPMTALEDALEEGQQDIEKIVAKGIQKFGKEFERGDDVAHRALQSLTIDVQASFLHNLILASKDDHGVGVDVDACVDAAIEARLRAVSVLNDLYLRQQKRSQVMVGLETLTISPAAKPTDVGVSGTAAKPADVGVSSTAAKPADVGVSGTAAARPIDIPPRTSNRADAVPHELESPLLSPSRSRKSSWNPFKNVHRGASTERDGPAQPKIRTLSSSTLTSPTLSPRIMSTSPGMLADLRRPPTLTPPMSPATTKAAPQTTTGADFCKGALSIQQGAYDKGAQVSMKHMEWACHCRKCAFATPADRDTHGRPRFDDRVYVTKQLRFRTLLLFKSHLPSVAKQTRTYKCLICVASGDGSSTYEGERHFFEHLSHHRGETLNGVELSGPLCLDPSGVQAASDRTFDLCLFNKFSLPPSAIELDVSEIVEADSREIGVDEDVFKHRWSVHSMR